MANLIISYRRSDSDVIAGRIRDRLVGHFGNDSVFMDIDSIPFGLDFREHIKKALLQNDIVFVVIGPKWLGQNDEGAARIFDETDPVRIEVETALQRNIPVIPILVAGATMPKPVELPDTLKDLAFRNAAIVDGGRDFHQHMDRLIRSTDRLLAEKSGERLVEHVADDRPAIARARPAKQIQINLRNSIMLFLAVGFVAALGGLLYVLMRPNPSLPQLGQATTPIQPLAQQSPQVEPSATPAGSEAMPQTPPPCRPANRSDAFFDDFKSQQLGWQPPVGTNVPGHGQVTSYAKNGVLFEVPVTKTYTELYTPLVFSSLSACAHIVNPAAIPAGDELASGGIAFWVQDAGNAYAISLFPQSASARLYRNVDGTWLPMGMITSPLVKTAPSAVNELQVVTKGTLGAYYVNGTKLSEFKGQPPSKSFAGIIAQSGTAQPIQWTFTDFAVYEYP